MCIRDRYFADRVDWAIILFNQGGGAEAGYSLFECYRLIPAALSAEIIDMGVLENEFCMQSDASTLPITDCPSYTPICTIGICIQGDVYKRQTVERVSSLTINLECKKPF